MLSLEGTGIVSNHKTKYPTRADKGSRPKVVEQNKFSSFVVE